MKSIFIDTHYLVAIINRLDQWHAPAINILSTLRKSRLIVTESIFIETLNYFAEFRSEIKLHAANSIKSFTKNPDVEVVEQNSEIFAKGMKFYESRLAKGYSLPTASQ